MNLFDLIKPYSRRLSLEDLGIYLNPVDTPPRNSTIIDQRRSAVVPAVSTLVLFDYLVPPFRRGILRRLAVDAQNPAGLPALSFSILTSGAPVPNYQNVTLPIGTIGTPDNVYVQYDREQHLQIAVTNSALVGYDVMVRVVAWFWDEIPEAGR